VCGGAVGGRRRPPDLLPPRGHHAAHVPVFVVGCVLHVSPCPRSGSTPTHITPGPNELSVRSEPALKPIELFLARKSAEHQQRWQSLGPKTHAIPPPWIFAALLQCPPRPTAVCLRALTTRRSQRGRGALRSRTSAVLHGTCHLQGANTTCRPTERPLNATCKNTSGCRGLSLGHVFRERRRRRAGVQNHTLAGRGPEHPDTATSIRRRHVRPAGSHVPRGIGAC
jgi:hypothetical protein